jgi:hypothetical protein
MKFFISLLTALLCLKPVVSEKSLYLLVVTLLQKEGLTSSQAQSVFSFMTADGAKLDAEISQVSSAYEYLFVPPNTTSTASNNWYLRTRDLQSCNPCPGYPTGFYCWYNGVRRPACRRERELKVHKALDETELSVLSESERQRHMQASGMCTEAIADVVAAVAADVNAGKITAPITSFSYDCLYDVV